MNAKRFRGTGVALVTPFDSEGKIDFESLRKLIEHVIAGGVEFLVALGTTAETPTLSEEEKKEVLRFVAEVNQKRLPLVCGIGGNNTREVLNQFKNYPLDDVDAILSVSPYYNKPTQQGIYAHFKLLNEHAPKPIILYNVPGRTGSNMGCELTIRLAHECEQIIGIKEACGQMGQSMELVKNCPADFTILSGDDDLTMAQIACGFDGVISVAANCFTRTFTDMVRLSLNQQFAEARKLQYQLLDGIALLFAEGNPAGVKAFLHKKGICQNQFRLPVVPVSEKTAQSIHAFPDLA